MNTKFSITVPAYKSQYLEECMDSVLSQTYSNFELIILNDASPENLDEIISKYQDERIRYYKNEKNVGAIDVVDNWNKLLEYAQGNYLICMGDDDKLLSNCLEEYNKLIALYPKMGVYHAWTEIINENSEVIDMQEPRPVWESVYSMAYFRMKGRTQYIGDFLFDTNNLKSKGGFVKRPLAWCSDDLSVWFAAKDTGIVNSQIPMFQYRVNSNTITNTGDTDLKIEAIKMGMINNISVEYKPNDAQDLLYWKNMKDNLDRNYRLSIIDNVATDIATHPFFRIMHWYKKLSYLEIHKKDLFYAILLGLKRGK
jgi:glycosyltransferase involved in cell wall biosynthesis